METIIFGILGLTFFILALVGVYKENKIRYTYKGIFGRPKAYLFMAGLMATIPFIVTLFALLSSLFSNDISAAHLITSLIPYVAVVLLAFLIGFITYRKCPPQLRKGLFLSMFLVGAGFAFKICLFFIPLIWKLGLPSEDQMRHEEERRRHDDQERENKREELRKHLYHKTGKNYYINSDGTAYKDEHGNWSKNY